MGSRSGLYFVLWLVLIDGTNGWLNRHPFNSHRQPSSTSDLSTKKIHREQQQRAQTHASATPFLLQASKFSQPAFSQPAFTGNGTAKQPSSQQQQQQQQERRRSKPVVRKYGADSKIASLHTQRVKTAGRVGTKRYIDPCKVFFGNLPFNLTEKALETWIAEQMGMPAPLLLSQVKVIRDWKTGDSKGYGFAVFTEAIHGTVCIEKCHRQLLDGRPLSVNQGKKKESTQIYIKKKKKPAADAEEAAIQVGMEEAAMRPRMDPQEALMLRQLDPDLVDDDFDGDDGLFDNDEDEEGVDGVYFEGDEDDYLESTEDEAPMNRKKRREVARQKKRRKQSDKGFGP